MRLLAIMGSPRLGQATDRLVEQTIKGFLSVVPHSVASKVCLGEKNIGHCRNCLACRDNLEATPYAPCVLRDDMTPLLDALHQADALIFGTPVHMAQVTSLMLTFLERICWTFAKPTRRVLTVAGCPMPRATKRRNAAILVVSGVVPPLLRRFCDDATPLLRQTLKDSLNCATVGSLYAGAVERRGIERYLPAAFALGRRLGATG